MDKAKIAKLAVLAIAVLSFGLTDKPALAAYSMLAPVNYTSPEYIQPQYDAFDHDYYRPPKIAYTVDTAPHADFNMFTNQRGFQNAAYGTTETVFIFDASTSTDNETSTANLEARWYFENDKIPDSYFSRAKSIRHIFKKAGAYAIKLEILDKGGNIASTIKKITVVENTPPLSYFTVEPERGTQGVIFHFDTSKSRDDQYLAAYLEYRFDWDGDGKWDTVFQNKNHWYHRFDAIGSHNVVMEARDPGGAKAVFSKTIVTFANTAPKALFTVRAAPGAGGKSYQFDASASSDAETAHRNLLYRWDFNYNGPNDIVYDTAWSHSDKYFGRFDKPERHVVKLEVKDEDGAISSAFAEVGA